MENRKIVIPGEKITDSANALPGEGTVKRDGGIYAMKYGLAEEQNNLVKLIPLSGVYTPRRGNVVVGVVEEITFNGWIINIGGADRAFLSLMEVPRYVNKDGLDEVMNYGDVVISKIWNINKRGIDLSIKSRGLGKVDGGIVIEINPHKVPRVIGKEGSMINLIKDNTGCNITVGQNGIVLIQGDSIEKELLAKAAILEIVDKCYISGLTEEITKWFEGKK